MKIFLSVLIVLATFGANAQEVVYSFDNCALNELSGQYKDGEASGEFDCKCGVSNDALYFDGQSNGLVLDSTITDLLEADFTLSFYFRIDGANAITDIFSVRGACNFDSLIALTYAPSSELLTLNIATTLGELKTFDTKLDASKCWHRFVLTKLDLQYDWYIDNILVDTYLPSEGISFPASARVAFSNGPCIDKNVQRYKGWIDEFTVHSRGLSRLEILANDYNPDQITTKDTTIVKGNRVNINIGSSCATEWTWSPEKTIEDPDALDILVTPSETTTYNVAFENNGCTTSDSVTIFVIDENALDCSKLLLPNAFTPNGDQLNDVFGISNEFLVEELTYFDIYNRTGALIWSTNSTTEKWDGSFKGNPVNAGTYLYQIKYTCNGESYTKVDNFTVLR